MKTLITIGLAVLFVAMKREGQIGRERGCRVPYRDGFNSYGEEFVGA